MQDYGQIFICDYVENHWHPFLSAVLCLKCFLTFCFAGKPDKAEVQWINQTGDLSNSLRELFCLKVWKNKVTPVHPQAEDGLSAGKKKCAWYLQMMENHLKRKVHISQLSCGCLILAGSGHREEFSLQRITAGPRPAQTCPETREGWRLHLPELWEALQQSQARGSQHLPLFWNWGCFLLPGNFKVTPKWTGGYSNLTVK